MRSGAPTQAAIAFARSCGVAGRRALERSPPTRAPGWCFAASSAAPRPQHCSGGIVNQAIAALPIAKRMRWGARSAEFVRPVHTRGAAVRRRGRAGRGTRPRVGPDHARPSLPCAAAHFAQVGRSPTRARLRRAKVIADFAARRELIRAGRRGGRRAGRRRARLIDGALLDEVTALVEWPVPIAGQFEARFLTLPREVVIATVQDHQRYFAVRRRRRQAHRRVRHGQQYREPRSRQGARGQRARGAAALERRRVLLGAGSQDLARRRTRRISAA